MKDSTANHVGMQKYAEASDQKCNHKIIIGRVTFVSNENAQKHGEYDTRAFDECFGRIVQKFHGSVSQSQVGGSNDRKSEKEQEGWFGKFGCWSCSDMGRETVSLIVTGTRSVF